MSAKIDMATSELARYKRIYQLGLAHVDRMLDSAVSDNSADLTPARTVQQTYAALAYGRVLPSIQEDRTALELLQVAESLTAALA